MAWCNAFCSFGTYVENLKDFVMVIYTNKNSTYTFTVIKYGKCETANFVQLLLAT